MTLKTSSIAFAAYKYVARHCNWGDLGFAFKLTAFRLRDASQAYKLSVKSCDSAHKSVQKLVMICSIRVGRNALSARRTLLMTPQPRQSTSRRPCSPYTSSMTRRLWHITYTSFFLLGQQEKATDICLIYLFQTREQSQWTLTWPKIYERRSKHDMRQRITSLQLIFPLAYERSVQKLLCCYQPKDTDSIPHPRA